MSTKTKQAYGRNSFVAKRPHHEYQLDLTCINHLENQRYDKALVCMYALPQNKSSVIPMKGKNAHDLAVGMIESIVKMG